MKRALLIAVSLFLILSAQILQAEQSRPSPYIALIRLDAPINPLSEHFVGSQLESAERNGAVLVVLDAAVREAYAASTMNIANRIAGSQIPVLVVPDSPAAAQSSALSYLEKAAVAWPAGSTNSPTTSAMITNLDGRVISFHGKNVVLHTAGLPVRGAAMNGVARLLSDILNPNLAYVLLLVGIIGVAVEFSLPGIGLPGIFGGLSLLISLIALGALSVNVGGLLIILLALGLFVFDIKAPTHGVLTAGGIIALLAGSFLLFPSRRALPGFTPVRISPLAIVLMTSLLAAVLLSAVIIGAQAQKRKVVVGRETLIGLPGLALTDVNPEGTVRVANEEWSATSVGDEIKEGEEVDVIDVRGVRLVVMRKL